MAQENFGKRFDGYQIYDQHYEKVGKVDDLFVDENDVPEYIGVKTSLFGGPSTLIPMEIVRVNDLRQLVEVASDKATIEKAPSFDDDAEITAEFEDRVYTHFGATRESPLAGRAPTTTRTPTWTWRTGSDPGRPNTAARYRLPPWSTSTPRIPQTRNAVTQRPGRKRSRLRSRERAHASTTGISGRSVGGRTEDTAALARQIPPPPARLARA
jgi:hypothetical protein